MEPEVKERPILMSGPMVLALLSGAKTQTRRVIKFPRDLELNGGLYKLEYERGRWWTYANNYPNMCAYSLKEPYEVGMRLWVRETHAIVPRTAYRCSEGVQQALKPDCWHDAAVYKAGWTRSTHGLRWKPSIHMPRWASRILLEVIGVRVERVQRISETDAVAEGYPAGCGISPIDWYADLWDTINAKRGYSLKSNPFVWVVEFKRIAPLPA